MTTRFAPSTSGEAHPGTLLSALLCWLDARSRGDRVILRFENLDPGRCLPGFVDRMRADLAWFGLDWDDEVVQSELGGQHQAALDALAAQGRLYPCRCSRSERRRHGRLAPDGGIAYDNTCRGRPLPAGGWRACREAVRLALPDRAVVMVDEGGVDLSQHPARDMGDPVLLRRDGAVAYHLAVVVDDAAGGVDRVVRGRDLVPSTATHVLIQELLGVPTPAYRHHLLFLEPSGGKLAKLHRSVGASELRACYTAAALCGFIAWAVGLQSGRAPRDCHPRELVSGFSWDRVARADQVLAWIENRLRLIA